MNVDKTEYTHIYLDTTITKTRKTEKKPEKWRTNVSLGTVLDAKSDVMKRIVSANCAFEKYKKLWLRKKIIGRKLSLRLYQSLVVPILIYNMNSLAVTNDVWEKIDTTHRRHLRQIMGYTWKDKITNEKLYEECEIKSSLTQTVAMSRWEYFGKVMRMPLTTPPQRAVMFAVVGSTKLKARKGRHQINLYECLKTDVKSNIGIEIKNEYDLTRLRELAQDEDAWIHYNKNASNINKKDTNKNTFEQIRYNLRKRPENAT